MNKRGLSLVEILITALVASVAIGATLVAFSQVFYLSEVSKDTTVAVSDIRDMIEDILGTAFTNISSEFPAGDQDGPNDTEYDNIVGGYTLNDEHIVVNYTAGTDPLELKITVTWTDMRGRSRSIQLSTFRTRYISVT